MSRPSLTRQVITRAPEEEATVVLVTNLYITNCWKLEGLDSSV